MLSFKYMPGHGIPASYYRLFPMGLPKLKTQHPMTYDKMIILCTPFRRTSNRIMFKCHQHVKFGTSLNC